ncbi:MAG: ATP phosphoribosyltransferase [Acidobacteriota bacterium]
MPRIALSKGRLLEPSLEWLVSIGLSRPSLEGRGLALPVGEGWEAVLLKGHDVPVFVQNGAADLGVVGSDILEEERPDVYDLSPLGFGRCRLSLAAPCPLEGLQGPLRIATKYPRTAGRLLEGRGLWGRFIRLSSSVELAPLLGLSDAIVDLVDTGRTLRENGLLELEVLQRVEAHLVANRRSYRFLDPRWLKVPSPGGTAGPGTCQMEGGV